MANDMRARILVEMFGNVPGVARNFGNALTGLGNRAATAFSRTDRALAGFGNRLERTSSRVSTLLGVGATALVARNLIELETRIERIGVRFQKTPDEMKVFRAELDALSKTTGVAVDELLAAVEAGESLEAFRTHAQTIALVTQATGASGASVVKLMTQFRALGIVGKDETLSAFDVLNKQAKMNGRTLDGLADDLDDVIKLYADLGRKGPTALREIGALYQVIRKGAGEQAPEALKSLIGTLNDRDSAAKLKAITTTKALQDRGVKPIQVFDIDALKKGRHELRPLADIIEEIMRASKGDVTKLKDIFDEKALRALTQFAKEWRETGKLDSLRNLKSVTGDGTDIRRDAARIGSTSSSELTKTKTAVQEFMDAQFHPWLKQGILLLREHNQEIIAGAAALGGMALAYKGLRATAGIANIFRRGDKAKASLDATMGARVFVTNWPAGMAKRWPGTVGDRADIIAPGKTRTPPRRMSTTGKVGIGAALLATGVGATELLRNNDTKDILGIGGMIAGALAGGKIGGGLGSFAGPVGALVGGLAGTILGGILGEDGMRWLADPKNLAKFAIKNPDPAFNQATALHPGLQTHTDLMGQWPGEKDPFQAWAEKRRAEKDKVQVDVKVDVTAQGIKTSADVRKTGNVDLDVDVGRSMLPALGN